MENVLKNIKNMDILAFQDDLISWFKREQRNLPWRHDKDPYKIWVSEIMLQQTRVDTVIPYFNRFLEWFPTVDVLAEAEDEKVLKAWEGLGYYSRVRNLHSAVKEVKEKYNGEIPNSPADIAKLKGVGPYTAGAISSIAFGIPEPAVDGNVMRVLSRIFSIWEDIAKPSTRKIFEIAIREIISQTDPSAFNQALMELGALICTPTSPSCLLCPVREHCRAFSDGTQTELPVKSKKTKQRNVQLATIVAINNHGEILIHKRPNKGLLASLWEFPNVEINLPIQIEREKITELFGESFELKMMPEKLIGQVEHIFSHLVWNIYVYTGKVYGDLPETGGWRFISFEEIKDYAIPIPFQKTLQLYKES